VVLQSLLFIHVLAGASALFVFWVPLVTAKGGTVHRRVGWVFVSAMAVAAVTAWGICGIRIAETTDEHQRATAAFLAYVGLLAVNTAWSGLRALRFKQRTTRHFHVLDLGIPSALLLAGVGTFLHGLQANMPLLMGFAPVGIVVGSLDLAYWLRPPKERMHWWFQHMAGMIGTCIATVTAFLAVNAQVIGIHSPGLILAIFLAPTLIGVPGMWLWARRYRRQFADKDGSQVQEEGGRP
jgi:uncharacterized membrane protein